MSIDQRKKRFKHGKSGQEAPKKVDQDVDENCPVVKMFRGFQQELDHRYDKNERVVKLSRDITIESKRTIFLLHRLDVSSDTENILVQAEEKLKQIENTKFKDVARELVDTDHYQFLRAYSPGLQEYIEALTFYFYLKENRLINLHEVEERLTFVQAADLEKGSGSETVKNTQETDDASDKETKDKPTNNTEVMDTDSSTKIIQVTVPPIEFILGVADLTGELMRKAINSVGSGDLTQPFKICTFLKTLESGCVAIGYASRELNRKLHTLQQSLRKVENACYTIQVRGSEIPKHMLVDALSKATVSTYNVDDSLVTEDD